MSLLARKQDRAYRFHHLQVPQGIVVVWINDDVTGGAGTRTAACALHVQVVTLSDVQDGFALTDFVRLLGAILQNKSYLQFFAWFRFFKWPWFKNEDVEKGRNLVVVVVRVSRDGEVRKRCAAMFDILAVCPARVTIFSIGGGLSIDTRSAYFV